MLFGYYYKKSMMHLMEEFEFDPRLKLPFLCLIVGSCGCGKSYFVKHILNNFEHLINEELANLWIYTSDQHLSIELQKENRKNNNFVTGPAESFEDGNMFPPEQPHLIVLVEVIFQVVFT